MDLKDLLKQMVEDHVSDIFIVAGLPFTYQIDGRKIPYNDTMLKPSDTKALISQLYALANRDMLPFEESQNHDDDFSFSLPGTGRFRVNVFRQRGSMGAIIRIIPFSLPDAEHLRLPEQVMKCADLTKGLVLVTGPAGAGKTSTLACIIDKINQERSGHIITLEDPIEYIHRHNKSIVTQREVPTDIATYSEALRSAMRESPDIILLGEMRDQETISAAITAAEMAQLIFSTLHTTGAANTVDRIIDAFPANQQRQIRTQLAMVLQAVISQQLVPAVDGTVVPAFEVMLATPAIRNLIREEKNHQLDSVIASSGNLGMMTMDQSLYNLYKDGTITKQTAMQYAIHPDALAHKLETEGK